MRACAASPRFSGVLLAWMRAAVPDEKRRLAWAKLGVVTICFLLFAAGPVQGAGAPFVVHRGAELDAPENTMAALKKAIELGANTAEVDIRATKDNKLVLLHDDTIDRTTDGKGRVDEIEYEELKLYDVGSWFDESFRGERVPLLSEALRFGKANDLRFELDVKASGIETELLAEVKRCGMLDRVLFFPGEWGFDKLQQLEPRARRITSWPDYLKDDNRDNMVTGLLDGQRGVMVRYAQVAADVLWRIKPGRAPVVSASAARDEWDTDFAARPAMFLAVVQRRLPALAQGLASLPKRDLTTSAIVSALIRALKDEDATLSRQAALALGKLRETRAVGALVRCLSDERAMVRENAAWALGLVGGKKAGQALRGLLKDPDRDVRREAVLSLGRMKQKVSVQALIAVLLEDADIDVRADAARALGVMGDRRAVEALIAALADERNAGTGGRRNSYLWTYCVRSLGRLGDSRAAISLAKAVVDNPGWRSYVWNTRIEAARALSKLGKDGITPLLLSALKNEDVSVRASAAWALIRIGADAVGPVGRMLKDENAFVRERAAWVTGWLGDERAVELLIQLLKDAEPDVRRTTAWALGRIGSARAIVPLKAIQADPDPAVRKNAAEALERITAASGRRAHNSEKPVVANPRDNLLANAGFERDADNDNFPDGWTIMQKPERWDWGILRSQEGVGLAADAAHRGAKSLKMWGNDFAAVSQKINVEPGSFYKVTAYCKTSGLKPMSAQLLVQTFPKKGSYIDYKRYKKVYHRAPNGQWALLEKLIQAEDTSERPAEALSVSLLLTDGKRGTAWWDDVSVVEIPEREARRLMEQRAPKIRCLVKGHPRLLFTKKDIPRLRAQAKGAHARLWESILSWPKAKLPAEPLFIPGSVMEHRGATHRSVRQARRPIEVLSVAYAVSKDEATGNLAKEWLLAMCKWGPLGTDHGAGLGRGEFMAAASFGYDCLHDYLSPEDREIVRDRLARETRLLYGQLVLTDEWDRLGLCTLQVNNVSILVGSMGAAALALLGEVPEAEHWLLEAIEAVQGVLDATRRDGGWGESVEYCQYEMTHCLYFIEALRRVTGIDMYDHPGLRKLGHFMLYTLCPGGKTHAVFGDDASGGSNSGGHHIALRLASEYRNSYLQWYGPPSYPFWCGASYGFLWYDPAVKPKFPGDLPSASCQFRDIGWAMLRSGWGDNNILMSFVCGPYVGGHTNNDDNAFALYVGDKVMARETRWGEHETWKHNTILVDGKGSNRGADSFLAEFIESPYYDCVVGDASTAYPKLLTKFLRHVVFMKPDYFVIFDELVAPKPSRFDWLLHPDVAEAEVEAGSITLHNDGARLAVRMLSPQHVACDTASPEGYRNKNPMLKLRPEQKLSRVNFLTVLYPRIAGDTAPIPPIRRIDSEGAIGLTLKRNGTTDIVLFALGEDGISYEGIETDGSKCAITRNEKGFVERFAVHNAKRLTVRGTELFGCTSVATAALGTNGRTFRGTLQLSHSGTVRVHCPHEPASVRVDDTAEGFSYDNARQQVVLQLRFGVWRIAISGHD